MVNPMPLGCLIHSLTRVDVKQHPLWPEKPECGPAQAVLSSEMLAGDRQAPFPLRGSWPWPRLRHQCCMMRRRGNVIRLY